MDHILKLILSTVLAIILLMAFGNAYALQADTSSEPLPISASQNMLSISQIEDDVALLKLAYKKIHPGYTRYADDAEMSLAWDNIISNATKTNGMTLGEFYLQIQQTLTLIRCDHTKANLPKVMGNERNTQGLYLPFRWTWIDERAFITIVNSDTNLEEFDEILSIDGRPIANMVEEVLPFIPYDGLTKWSRNAGVSESQEFYGGAVDHFGALLWEIKPTVDVTFKRPGEAPKTVQLNRINFKQWKALAKLKKAPRGFMDAVTYKEIGEDIAYLRIDSFVNYREPVEPNDIYEPIFKAIKKQKSKTLILDLRNNGGGSTEPAQALLGYLISEKMQYKLDMRINTLSFQDVRPYLSTWDERALEPNWIGFSENDDGSYSLRSWVTDDLDTVKPTKYAFTGKIIALTSNTNSSGSTNLLSVIKSALDVTLVGEKTGGSMQGPTAGLLFTLTLPASKITTRLPFFLTTNNVTNPILGMGLVPDVMAPMTAEAFIMQQDPALEAAIRLANGGEANTYAQ